MFKLTSADNFRSSIMIAAASILFLASASPAAALCRYGSPNCVNPHRVVVHQAAPPTIDGTGNGWQDPDCKYYGNCLADNHDTGCWYSNGVCQPNDQPQQPPRADSSQRFEANTATTLLQSRQR